MRSKFVALVFFFVVLDIMLVLKIFDKENGIPAYKVLQEKISNIKDDMKSVDDANRQMSFEIRVLKTDPQYVERLIKRELFYVSENETMYIVK